MLSIAGSLSRLPPAAWPLRTRWRRPSGAGGERRKNQGDRLRWLSDHRSAPVFAKADEIFPGKGAELSNAWRTRQFEYTWLRTLGGSYVDFWQVTEESLMFAAKCSRSSCPPTSAIN